MNHISVIVFLLLPFSVLTVEGPNVCITEKIEAKPQKVPAKVPRKYSIIEWCSKPPTFRCHVEKVEMVDGFDEIIVHERKNYSECCEGYTQPLGRQICIPVCSDPCLHGICSAPNLCSCNAGWTGSQCDLRCPSGTKGPDCTDFCNCHHGSSCNPANGECLCKAGWIGEDCSKECPSGFFGLKCAEKCMCKNGAQCDKVSGACKCEAGFKGRYCDVECRNTGDPECEKSCHCQNNGTCVFSENYVKCECKPGYYGQHCERVCPQGTYGPDCNKVCDCNLQNDICDPESGCVPVFLPLDATLDNSGNDSMFILTSCLLLSILCLMLIVYRYRERYKKLKAEKSFVTFVAEKNSSDHVDNPGYSFADSSNVKLFSPSTSSMKSHLYSLKNDFSLLRNQEKWSKSLNDSPPPSWESLGAHARSPEDRVENIYLNSPCSKSTSSSLNFDSKEPLYEEISHNTLRADDSASSYYDEPKQTHIKFNDLDQDDKNYDNV